MIDLLHRYTNLAATIHLLRERKLTLLDPTSWDDKNDVFFMEEYKRSMRAKSVLALCFAHRRTSTETNHHWRVFANGPNGVCIQFDKIGLTSIFEREGIEHGSVKYLPLRRLSEVVDERSVGSDDLPFIKGSRYKAEREYRAIYISESEEKNSHAVSMDLDIIHKVTLSPWLPPSVANAVKKALPSLAECKMLNVLHSTLRDNKNWKKLGRKLRNRNANVDRQIKK